MGRLNNDPVEKALKDLKKDAQRRAQNSTNRAASERGSADWHLADSALKAWRRK